MLVLSRKVGERILIGEHVELTIVRITPNGVRIGIDAPPDMMVVRKELKEAASKAEDPAEAAKVKPR